MNCQKCQQEIFMPFQCPYCGGQFCSEHRLPENHSCPNMSIAQAQRQQSVGDSFAPKAGGGYSYTFSFGQPIKRQNHVYFSSKEITHISIAALLVIGIGFSIGLYSNYFGGFSFYWTYAMMTIFAVVMVASFLVHEIAHKIMAQRRGLWAEFRLTTWGAILTFASVFLPFRMIAPGAMMIAGSPDADGIVKISVAGPITNLMFSISFFGAALFLPGDYGALMMFASYINAFMAVFNLIPIGILDGYKIFSFNKPLWALVFIPSAVLAVFTFLLIG
jgi:Zn-dependent protease